jgi:phage shock protein C
MTPVLQKNWHWIRAEDGVLGGVCLGIARQFDLSPLLVRILWLTSVLFFGTGLALYIACLIAFPRSDKLEHAHDKMVLGVCARIGKRGDIEVGLARLGAIFLLCTTFGAAIVGYIVLHFVLSPNTKSIV